MKYPKGRMLATILLPLAVGGTVAGCGDDTTSTGGGSADRPATSSPSASPSASPAQVDGAFVRQMVPHHLMAVDMAEMAKTGAEHDEIKTLSAEIIESQSKEITALQAVAKELGVTPDKPMGEDGAHGEWMNQDAKTLGLSMGEMGMSMDMAALETADPFDKAFIEQMTAHHKGAVAMAKAQLAAGENAELEKIATAIVSAQERELTQMAEWKAEWYPGTEGASAASGDADHSGMGH